jgi:hypothetical protein
MEARAAIGERNGQPYETGALTARLVARHNAIFSSFTSRPYATHSATKILPSWSKAASCGQTNFPGVN